MVGGNLPPPQNDALDLIGFVLLPHILPNLPSPSAPPPLSPSPSHLLNTAALLVKAQFFLVYLEKIRGGCSYLMVVVYFYYEKVQEVAYLRAFINSFPAISLSHKRHV